MPWRERKHDEKEIICIPSSDGQQECVGRTMQTMQTAREAVIVGREPGVEWNENTDVTGSASCGTSVAQRLILLSLMDVRLPLSL